MAQTAAMKLAIDRYIAFEVEKMLIGLHPTARFIRVNPTSTGLAAEVEAEDGRRLDVSAEMTSYINRKLEQMK